LRWLKVSASILKPIEPRVVAMMQASYRRREFITLAMSPLFIPRGLAEEPASGDAKFTQDSTRLVEQSEREDKFYGVILVARGDKVLLRKAAGFADRARNLPNSIGTQFPIESITKQFTATAIMMLVERNKIALDASILEFYPKAPAEWAGITIKHLLTHSSGIGDQSFNGANMDDLRIHNDVAPFVTSKTLLFEPGSGFQYFNTGYVLLAGVIEHTSGETYERFLNDRIFIPLGMNKTGFHPSPNLKGYVPSIDGSVREAAFFEEPAGPDGPGGIYSTADDLLTWSRAWDDGRILSVSSRRAALTDYGHDYGFGWRFSPKFGRNLVWHTGSFDPAGFASILDRFPNEKLTFIVLTNALSKTDTTATLVIEGKETTFPADAARKLLEAVETLYFGRVRL
jgi:D-alanyl-D-alanine carboxypeptidase